MASSTFVDEVVKILQESSELCFEKNRRKTFTRWVFNDKARCNAAKMAEAGFVFAGTKHEPDAVKCYMCEKNLDSWEEDDDPWAEHKKHSSQCMFLKFGKPEKQLKLSEFVDCRNEFILQQLDKKLQEQKTIVVDHFDQVIKELSMLK